MKASTVAPTDIERAGRRAADLRRAHQAAVRSAGAGVPGRHHARRHAAVRARPDRPHLSGERGADVGLPRRVAPRRRSASRSRCCSKINQYHVKMLAYFVEKLAKTQDGDGTLLDHSLVLYGSNMGNSNQHLHYDVPHVLVGGAERTAQGRPPPRVSDQDRADRQPAAERPGQVRHPPGQHRRQRTAKLASALVSDASGTRDEPECARSRILSCITARRGCCRRRWRGAGTQPTSPTRRCAATRRRCAR